MDEIFKRRSIRKFTDEKVDDDKIEKLLRAAMQAPSAANQQPWEFIVVKEKTTLKALSEVSLYAKPTEGSSAAILLLADSQNLKVPTAWEQDLGAATQNILLEAVHLNLGAVWMGIATSETAAENIVKLFGLPENIKPFALIAVGYPAEQKNEFVDRYKPERIHYEKW
ncbi:nitroreductase family protein [Anaerocolumna chitinilytica]|uniref:Nitroreductase n=1 Tax=Anaerocolumna chitinilytica TaxID=1727145 RepID=A0A7I8DMD2_9FIRM|nr:nitroreductase family protein [Anaerocolumna chitinilytica]BCJ99540.1 nitroreductase [Anaerocolumna chitinilytica]